MISHFDSYERVACFLAGIDLAVDCSTAFPGKSTLCAQPKKKKTFPVEMWIIVAQKSAFLLEHSFPFEFPPTRTNRLRYGKLGSNSSSCGVHFLANQYGTSYGVDLVPCDTKPLCISLQQQPAAHNKLSTFVDLISFERFPSCICSPPPHRPPYP